MILIFTITIIFNITQPSLLNPSLQYHQYPEKYPFFSAFFNREQDIEDTIIDNIITRLSEEGYEIITYNDTTEGLFYTPAQLKKNYIYGFAEYWNRKIYIDSSLRGYLRYKILLHEYSHITAYEKGKRFLDGENDFYEEILFNKASNKILCFHCLFGLPNTGTIWLLAPYDNPDEYREILATNKMNEEIKN